MRKNYLAVLYRNLVGYMEHKVSKAKDEEYLKEALSRREITCRP